MNHDTPIKKYPVTTSEVAKMLGINNPDKDLPLGTFTPKDEHTSVDSTVHNEHPDEHGHEVKDAHLDGGAENKPSQPAFVKVGKAIAPYAAVFTVGLFLYYFFFTGVDFTSMFKSTPKVSTPKETALQQLQRKDAAAYEAWIKGFYYDVSDPKLLDPENDNSGNGLSNFQKYLLNLNPKSYDTLGLGMSDSQAIAAGINPATGVALTETQKTILAQYVDMEVVSNKLALSNLRNAPQVAGASLSTRGDFIPAGQQSNSAFVPPVDRVPGSDIEVNTDIPGRLEIPSLKVNAPIIWSKDPKNFDKDLQMGVIHYPGTALPGEIGTTYISGHSSNYAWAKGDYNNVFTRLNNLADNTSFKITVVQKNGKDAIFHYVVTGRKQYLPTDPEQYQNTGKSKVALSTCWPIGSTAKRLVVFGELTQTVK
jgi:LPXTG-site transpeptidase (sortase) family protein